MVEVEKIAVDEGVDSGVNGVEGWGVVEGFGRWGGGQGIFEVVEVDAVGGAEAEHDALVVEVEVGEGFGFFVADAFQVGGYVGSVPAASAMAIVAVGAWA